MVDDPLERVNLKERRRDVYARMVGEWNAWNRTMLPELKESATGSATGDRLADHYGVPAATGEVDDVSVWPEPQAD